jgi:transposase
MTRRAHHRAWDQRLFDDPDVARRHGLSPQQLFTWRREARRGPAAPAPEVARVFVPAVVHEASVGGGDKTNKKAARRRRGRQTNGIIEVEIDGVTVRVGGGADAKTVAAVIRALKATT